MSSPQSAMAPVGDVLEVVAGRDRTADHQEQNLRQRMRHPPGLPVVLDQREMVEQQPQPRFSLAQAWQGSPNHRRRQNHNPRNPQTAVNPSSEPWSAYPGYCVGGGSAV